MSGGRIRRQHVVSRFYLRRFADSKGQLLRTVLPGETSHPVSVNDATVIKDFYSVTLPSGEVSDFFERQLGEVEKVAAPAFARMLDEGAWPIKGEDRFSIASWIALQYMRSESVRIRQNEILAQTIRLVVGLSGKRALKQHIESREKTPISQRRLDAEWADLTGAVGPTLIPDVKEHIQQIYALVEPTARMLADRQWILVIFSRRPILTCDHPVSLQVTEDYPKHRGVGLATADAYLVPMTPRKFLLIGASRDLPDTRIPGTTALAHDANLYTIHNARSHLYWDPSDSEKLRNYPMPKPREREMMELVGEHEIREEGFFGNMGDDERRTLSRLRKDRPDEDATSAYTLRDLPWPIPGRVFDFKEP